MAIPDLDGFSNKKSCQPPSSLVVGGMHCVRSSTVTVHARAFASWRSPRLRHGGTCAAKASSSRLTDCGDGCDCGCGGGGCGCGGGGCGAHRPSWDCGDGLRDSKKLCECRCATTDRECERECERECDRERDRERELSEDRSDTKGQSDSRQTLAGRRASCRLPQRRAVRVLRVRVL